MLTEIIGYSAAAMTSFAGFPQLIKIIKTRHTKDLSLEMYLMICAGVALWLIYGFLKSDMPLIVANLVALSINIPLLIFKLKYR